MGAQTVVPPLQPPLAALPCGSLPMASLYVGDLDPAVTEKDLKEVFRPLGPLFSVRLCRDRHSSMSLRYGYVNFFSHSDASKALACLNHTELKGKPMRIMWCQRDPLKRKTGVGNLFVKNLHHSVTGTELESIFSKFGTILSCKVAEEHGKSKGFGFVQFESVGSSIAALNTLHGTFLEGKKLFVSKFVKKTERKNCHEEPKFSNLYVKNLGENMTEKIIQDKFSEFGEVCNATIAKDADGKSKGFGSVNFESNQEDEQAVKALNGAALGSGKLCVTEAEEKVEREDSSGYAEKLRESNLYVKNLNASIDDRKLEEHFRSYGNVVSAKVMRYDNGTSKGFGFVSFSSSEEAKKALKALHGTVLQGRYLYVGIAQRKADRQKALQNHYARQTPQFHLPFYNIPPFPAQSLVSRINLPWPMAYQPCGEAFQRNTSTYQMRLNKSSTPTQELNFWSCKSQNLHWNKRTGFAEASSSIGFLGETALTPSSFLGNSKQVRYSNSIMYNRKLKIGSSKDQKISSKEVAAADAPSK